MDQYAGLLVCILILISSFPSPSLCQSDDTECPTVPFVCGPVSQDISFPFWGGPVGLSRCSDTGFQLRCVGNNHFVISISGIQHRVISINQQSYSMILARSDLWTNVCSTARLPNSGSPLFAYPYETANVGNLTLAYDCSDFVFNYYTKRLPCAARNFYFNDTFLAYVRDDVSVYCSGGILRVLVDRSALDQIENGRVGVVDGLKQGFQLNYTNFMLCHQCNRTGRGVCAFDSSANFICSSSHSSQKPTHNKSKIQIGIGAGIGGGILFMIITFCCCKIIKSLNFLLSLTKKDRDIEAFIRGNGHLTAKRYRFSDVKKMTKSFKDKLGQGGFGEVYKGKFSDDRLVAVKLLNSSKGNGEEFINEVASISRTSHVNIVTLLGFCLEGGKRALIYEFMSNGSLEKFLFSDNTSQTNPSLDWDKLIHIATGIARGLEYLHRGCSTRILHFDIKPHNILLDEDFCPKISNFGLAKLYPNNKQSNMSLLDARGTIGYIAPEVFNRNFGTVSSKSDVYSYGMMILEMVGGRKNITVGVSRTSEIYFPDWVYKHLEVENKLKIWGDMTSEENGIARKMVLVGLWCIQIAPSDRPSMSKVIEMLEGSLEALQIPPKPTLFSSRSSEAQLAIESSTTSLL